MKKLNEWYIKAPWGKIALASWGNLQGDPVLLVHGRQDSLDTFIPLLKFLPEKFHYVGLDLPGHGKSDAFPTGVALTRLVPVSAIDIVIKHLKWKKFVYIGHSMGAELGLFYNILNLNKISKLILLDVRPGLQRLQISDLPYYFKTFYNEYYSHYSKYNIDDRTYSKERALEAVMKARGMTKAQAEVILERNLKEVGEDTYKLSWDKRQKIIAPSNFPQEYYMEIFSKNTPPSLFINATESSEQFYSKGKDAANNILAHLKKKVKYVSMVDVHGGHDVHFTNPERIEKYVVDFLNKDFGWKSKL
ncbi:serine hydrolase-like protein [Epargyreus clarus]|uniref:serine hydrolase-like protein n=1 Tax=Epargyreus clarus TaxID=520877 RepID=UPI003C2C100A